MTNFLKFRPSGDKVITYCDPKKNTISPAGKIARDKLLAELNAVKAAQSQPAVKPTDAEPAKPAPESIDWELYAEISKQFTEQGTPHKATQWLQEQIQAIQGKREEVLREEFQKPQREATRWFPQQQEQPDASC